MNATANGRSTYTDEDGRVHVPLKEAHLRLGICRKTAYRWRDKGWLTFVKHEGRIWCPESELVNPGQEAGHASS